MKVTGTKKLLIILFALTCALALGFGVVIARNASTGKGGVAYAEVTLPEATDAETSTEDGEEVSDAEEEKAEEEYDPRYDEGVIAEIAKLADIDASFVSLYCHVRNIDANDLLSSIIDGQEKLRNNSADEFGYMMKTPDGEVEGELPEENVNDEEDSLFNIYSDMHSFAEEYYQGEVVVSEDEDWFLDPDSVSGYVNYRYVGYNNSNFLNGNRITYYKSTTGTSGWSQIYP